MESGWLDRVILLRWLPEWFGYWIGRVTCWLGLHNLTCRGRDDHWQAR